MKIETEDILVAVVAFFMLAAYIKLQSAAFLYVFIVLLAAELIATFIGEKRTEK